MVQIGDTRYKWWIRDLLELFILIAVLILIAVIYVPRAIWNEEEAIRDKSRFRMENVYDVLTFYKKLTAETTGDGLWALNLVNAARDSLTADSTFLGNQKIYLLDRATDVFLYQGYDAEYDTAFGFLRSRKDTILDTVLTVLTYNPDRDTNDTSFIRLERSKRYLEDSLFVGIVDTVISSHVEVVSYYDSYMPDSSMFVCPLTGDPYKIEVSEESIKVESPIEETYREPRYLVFSFKSESHGWIEDGEKSWSRF